MENTTSHASGKTQLIFIVSNVMGVGQGFEWRELPLTEDDLTELLDAHQSLENYEHAKMLEWKKEGMIIDGPTEEPGVLIWYVEIDDTVIDITDSNLDRLDTLYGVVLQAIETRPAHINSDFKGGTNAMLAVKILSGLKEMLPIKIDKVTCNPFL